MKKLFVSSVLLLFVFVTANAQDPVKLLAGVRDRLGKVKDYMAEGIMLTDIPFIKIGDAPVKVYFRQPNQFKVLRSNGISIIPKGGVQGSLHAILSGKEFTPVAAGYTAIGNRKLAVIKLLPTDEQSEVVLTTLYIDEATGLVWKTTSTTRNNGSYETILQYGRQAAWGLPDEVQFIFNISEFKLPKGVTMEYEGGKDAGKATPKKGDKGSITIRYSSYIINKGIPDAVFK